MPKFYIEIPHEGEPVACLKAIQILQQTGSHFLTHAEYGCMDGDHTARIIVEMDNKRDALMIVPNAYRPSAKVIQLSRFSAEEVDKMLKHHNG